MKNIRITLFIILLSGISSYAQPYVEIANFNAQQLNTNYISSGKYNSTTNYFGGLLLPFKVNSKNNVIVRLNAEQLISQNSSQPNARVSLYAFTPGIGMQHTFNDKLSAVWLFMPKVASDLTEEFNSNDRQYGGSLLIQYKISKNLRVRGGLYYNREPFGNFFVPLVGCDWQISKRWMWYGTFPFFNRLEYKINEHLYTGVGARIFGRSYRLNSYWNRDYVWNQENQIKYFLDYYITQKLVCYAEVGRTIAYGPKQIAFGQSRDNVMSNNPLYSPIEQGFFMNIGVALRIRKGI